VVCMISKLFSYKKHSRRGENRSHCPMSNFLPWKELMQWGNWLSVMKLQFY